MSILPTQPSGPVIRTDQSGFPFPLLVTADDIAEALSISRRTVFRLRARGDLPPPVELTRNVVRWRWTDVCDYLGRLKPRKPSRR